MDLMSSSDRYWVGDDEEKGGSAVGLIEHRRCYPDVPVAQPSQVAGPFFRRAEGC